MHIDKEVVEKVLTLENMNSAIRTMRASLLNPVVIRAGEIEEELYRKETRKPFEELIIANVGDAQAMGQRPITYIRQLLAVITFPELINDSRFPEDVKTRAVTILSDCYGGSIGSYTDGRGLEVVRKHTAQYIERRDEGIPCNYQDIILSTGATEGIRSILKLLNEEIDGKIPGIMIPIPQYPLYSATLDEYSMHQIPYYLDESNNWNLDMNELERAIQQAKQVCNPRAIVIINPGNPTGQVLSRANIEDIIRFAYKERLFILADEVYQTNVYAEGCKFVSFKKVLMELGHPYSKMELASFMSCSKGFSGECGLRGGYVEMLNLDAKIKDMLMKMLSCTLCSNIHGQATLECIVNPPIPGEESYDLFESEKEDILKSMANRAKLVTDTFNSIPGFSCNPIQGAMYAFPRIHLPEKTVSMAESFGLCADTFYALELLEQTGICVNPGSGFGQRLGTYHFRTTILPQPEKLKVMLQKMKEFHIKFLHEYG